MTEILLVLLRLAFIALLLVFVLQVARAMGAHVGPLTSNRGGRADRVMVLRSDRQSGSTYRVRDALVFGRSPEADVFLDDPYASEFHLRFNADGAKMSVTDLGSTNGTYVNGKRLDAPVTLTRGDNVQVGKTVMEIR